MLFLKCFLSPVRYSVIWSIFSKHSLILTSNFSNVTPTKPGTEAKEDYRQQRQIAMSQFLLNECGFSESQVLDLGSRRPQLFKTTSTHGAQQAVQFLRSSGFTEDQVRKILFLQPSVLSLKVDTHKIPILVSLFGSKLNLCKALMSFPRILWCKVENLKPKIDILKQYGIQDGLFLYVLNARPNLLLGNSEEALKSKIQYVQNLGILEGSKVFAAILMAVDSSGLENCENKLKHMAMLGLLENEIIQIVKREPRTLAISIDKTKKNMDFLTLTVGFQPNIVVSYPRLLCYSIENRMQPRHKVIEFLRETEPSKLPTSLASVYKLSEKLFARMFLKGSPEAAKLFENYKGKSDGPSIS